MKDKSSIKTEVLKEAKQLLDQGKSRQETFQTLLEKYNNAKIIVDIVKDLPAAIALKKFGFLNIILLVSLIIPAIFLMISAPNLGIIGWMGFLIYNVAKKNFEYYTYVSLIATCGLLVIVAFLFDYSSKPMNWSSFVIIAFIFILFIVLPIWIKNKICPKPIETREKYINAQGQERIRIRYEFRDI